MYEFQQPGAGRRRRGARLHGAHRHDAGGRHASIPEAFTGTPTGFNVDVNVGETAAVKALAANTAGTAGEWKAGHLGGSKVAVAIAAGDAVTVDVNLAGGTTPTADYDVHLWLLEGTV